MVYHRRKLFVIPNKTRGEIHFALQVIIFGNTTIFVKMRWCSILLYYGYMRSRALGELENEPKWRFSGGRFP